ncbi:MAG TPA: Ppx/GppA phosphatase family protein [Myxococcales bacterium]|nr:Ppx/GppA phosphatase family protein [Myxococcales bacterium]
MPPSTVPPVLAAIDVGTNAVRLELARPLPDGSLELLHQERDPLRPGEGVFKTGVISRDVADRLMSTLRRYGALCHRFHAKVRAVATSAVREAKNREEIVRRARREAGIDLEVVSGREEARLICLGVLSGQPAHVRSLVVDIGGGSTEVALAHGDRPDQLWSVAVGAVRLAEIFPAPGRVKQKRLALMRSFAEEAFRDALPEHLPARHVLGSSGTINAVVSFASGSAQATLRQVSRAVDDLAEMAPEERRKRFDSRRAEIVVAGAVILEAVMSRAGLPQISAVDRGLRDGLLIDLNRRSRTGGRDPSLFEAALALGRRFAFDEAHGRHTAKLALMLFDGLAQLHQLPAAGRPLLEVAALLHDVGNAVSYSRHHKHSFYLIQNADLPGLTDRERGLVARVARFHRRGAPEPGHIDLEGLSAPEVQLVRKLSTLLRLADSFDRSHHQPVRGLRINLTRNAVDVQLRARAPCDLELWDAENEAALFGRVFRRRLDLSSTRR